MYYKLTSNLKQKLKFIEDYLGISFNANSPNAARSAEKFINKYYHKAETMERIMKR